MKLNEGLIYTNDNCIGCNRCISGCPVLGANISVKRRDRNRIYVDGDACIQCGKCLKTCQHNAREYRDDSQRFLQGLREGEKISLLVAPSFFGIYGEKAKTMLGRIKALGVRRIYDVSYGADIAIWAYLSWLREHPMQGAIAPPCPANMNYIQKYSKVLTDKIIPIYSPVLCLAVYLRRYQEVSDQLAFLSPCIAKKHEIEEPDCSGLIQYNVTFAHLEEMLLTEPQQTQVQQVEPELSDCGLGRIFPIPGGLSANLKHFLPQNETIREIHGVGYVYDYIGSLEHRVEAGGALPHVIDCLNCSFGCLDGTGLQTGQRKAQDEVFIRMQSDQKPNPLIPEDENPYLPQLPIQERCARLQKRFAQFRLEDFTRSYCRNEERKSDCFREMREVDEARLNTIFREMYKYTEAERSIDCHSCGYKSCRDMAIAIARGYNSKENCIYYLKDNGIKMAMKDPRYGIYNNIAFSNFLEEIIAKGRQEDYVCLQFNILHFNRINQSYGYQQGDIIMKLYCNLVGAMARDGEMIALLGGNNFVAAFEKDRLEWAVSQLTGGVRVPFFPGDEIRLMARVAVYWPLIQDTSAPMIMERVALTYGLLQQNSKSKVMYYDKELRRRLEEEDRISELIEPAMQRKEFEVYYQPKVNMQTRQITGAEALIRWNHAGAVISPGTFIPLCEKRGLIEKLDFFVLESVCESISRWIEQGLRLVPISVNFSKQHFVNRNVADQINAVASRFDTPRRFLEVEFTETAYMEDCDGLIYSIDRLHEYGIASSMDDFGTGYSSLSMLQDMSFDTLKLDKSFLDEERYVQHRGRTVIENIIRMAKQLNMTIVSEGIETEDELKFMRSMGCDVAQGFLFDRPLRHADFESRLNEEFYRIVSDTE